MTLADARALAGHHVFASAPEYQRAQLQVLLAILDRLEAPAPPVEVAAPVAPVAEPAPVPEKPTRKPKG
jgi:hypothetical protein